ncbi:Protopanaxadiol 6-hydroxylase [Sesamum angolense]|uniref:Protopanaxadiol 6-hydroxylase n=1 Tax=Sesamum angolense TaxID=2727404 RepID=A0AAE1W7M2_9LAMI|nr:Protopanaxadiol 6-hydroxylase [Sesamum angolense]
MEIFLPYVIPLLLLLLFPLFLYLISFMPENGSGNKNLPPGTRGWPVLGENMELALSGQPKFIKHRMEKYSQDVFQTSLFGEMLKTVAQKNHLGPPVTIGRQFHFGPFHESLCGWPSWLCSETAFVARPLWVTPFVN